MEALQQMTRVKTAVRRSGEVKEIPAEELVPGDIVVIGAGDIVPADLRVFEANKMQVDESALTGESVPVPKTTDPIENNRPLAERKNMFILYLLSGNIAEIMIVGCAILAGAPLPILPLQILYLNMLGDVFPALALGLGKSDPSKMKRPPRQPNEPILTRGHWFAIGGYGILICVMVLAAFALAFVWLEAEESRAVTVSFLTLAFARLWHTFNMRDPGTAFFRNEVTRNPFVWAAIALCAGLLVVAIYLPGLSLVLSLEPPGTNGWILILGMSLVPWAVGQVLKGRH